MNDNEYKDHEPAVWLLLLVILAIMAVILLNGLSVDWRDIP